MKYPGIVYFSCPGAPKGWILAPGQDANEQPLWLSARVYKNHNELIWPLSLFSRNAQITSILISVDSCPQICPVLALFSQWIPFKWNMPRTTFTLAGQQRLSKAAEDPKAQKVISSNIPCCHSNQSLTKLFCLIHPFLDSPIAHTSLLHMKPDLKAAASSIAPEIIATIALLREDQELQSVGIQTTNKKNEQPVPSQEKC